MDFRSSASKLITSSQSLLSNAGRSLGKIGSGGSSTPSMEIPRENPTFKVLTELKALL